MEYKQAIGVIMHKLLRVGHGMLKANKPFDPSVNRINRQKSGPRATQVQEQHKIDLIYEELQAMSQGPCSRRALRKVKADL